MVWLLRCALLFKGAASKPTSLQFGRHGSCAEHRAVTGAAGQRAFYAPSPSTKLHEEVNNVVWIHLFAQ